MAITDDLFLMNPMLSAAGRFARIPELLAFLGRMIINRTLLYDLCLSSRQFNASFTAFLYEEVWFRADNVHVLIDIPRFLNNPSLKYIEKVDFSIARLSVKHTGHSEGQLCQLYNEAVKGLLERTPDLISFS
jgi:hypothetical protein